MLNGPLRLAVATALGAVAATCVLFALAPSHPARAANFDRYVAIGGRDELDCVNPNQPCLTPQYAIDQASSGDVIKIAAGVYTSVLTHAFTTTGAYSFTQIAFISKTLTLSGGYTVTDNWAAVDPAANPTVFNAGGAGRGVTVFGSGTEAVTVTGLTLTGGDYTGLGNPAGVARNCRSLGADCGGGFYATKVQIHASELTVTGNIVSRTRSLGRGGGMALESTLAGSTLDHLTVIGNQAPSSDSYGGGLALYATSSVTVIDSTFANNSARGGGGGVSIVDPVGHIQFIGVRIEENAGGQGAAVYAETYSASNIGMQQVEVLTNSTSAGDVITFHAWGSNYTNSLQLRNVLIAGTTVTFSVPSSGLIHTEVGYGPGSELIVDAAHLTAAANEGIALLDIQAVSTGVTSTLSSGVFAAALTNTIVSGLPALFLPVEMEPSQITITATRTLTEGVPAISTGVVGTPTITLFETVTGQPRLGTDYRPRAFSAAIDAGRDVGVTVDASGAARDARPDIGALEAAPGTMTRVYVPSLLK